MALPRVFRTTSFRLTLLYAALFSVSVVVLFAIIYWSASSHMTGQLDAAVDSDFAELTQGFRSGGAARVASLIEDRVRDMPKGPMFYLLENASGKAVAGNLPALPRRVGIFDAVDPRPAPHRDDRRPLRARGTLLKGGDYLMVATDASQRNEMDEEILRAFAWGSLASLLLAFGGGLMLSGGLLRRVEAISRTAREIMAGHLSRRVPARGTDDEFDRLAASLNAMLERTEQSMHAMRQISNDIAHDLRTPLTRLRQRLELAERKGTSLPELRAAIASAIGETDAILATFGALLRIAQIESGAIRAGFTDCDLGDLLRTVVEVYQPMADDKRQSLSAEIAPQLEMFGDRELLTQMLANLLENAIRHSPRDAVIRLSAAPGGSDGDGNGGDGGDGGEGGITVILSDTGPGIPAAEYQNVFRRFYRLEASRTTPGNGLGLSLVAAIAGLHGISLAFADNEPGLKVTMTIPRAAALALPTIAAALPG